MANTNSWCVRTKNKYIKIYITIYLLTLSQFNCCSQDTYYVYLEGSEAGNFLNVRREAGDLQAPGHEAAQRLQVLARKTPHAGAVVRTSSVRIKWLCLYCIIIITNLGYCYPYYMIPTIYIEIVAA